MTTAKREPKLFAPNVDHFASIAIESSTFRVNSVHTSARYVNYVRLVVVVVVVVYFNVERIMFFFLGV